MKKIGLFFTSVLVMLVAFCTKDKTPDGGGGTSVTSVTVANVSVSPTSLALAPQEKSTLKFTITPENATNKAVTWSSDKEAVATVNDKGEVTAVAVGKANIKVTTKDGNKEAVCAVEVAILSTRVDKVTVDPTTLSIKVVGQTGTLTATVEPADATNKEVTWSSDNENVATVDDKGVVTAQGAGKANIKVTTKDGNKEAVCAVEVTDSKPMPPAAATYNCPDRKEPMKMVAYVETNSYDPRNHANVTLKTSGKPVFDFIVLFAANMIEDKKEANRRLLAFNKQLKPVISDPNTYIKPIRDKGIKVILDILPHHAGFGYLNFQSYEDALSFARQCKAVADRTGIDGFDIDEEYARYDKKPNMPVKGAQSLLWFMRAMKEVMPDKLLTAFDYGLGYSTSDKDEFGKTAADYVDYTFANYGTRGGSSLGLPKERHASSSVEANWGLGSASGYATYNLENCYGALMFFNINAPSLNSGAAFSDLSRVTQAFYGEDCEYTGENYPPLPSIGNNEEYE